MEKCAISIGVNNTGSLPGLKGAVSGANAFANWALSQGFTCETLTDDKGPVTVTAIKAIIRAFVDSGTYDLLIIYFAGHGILKSAVQELWLLSGAPDDTGEAVDLHKSRILARYSGIPHVVFISDSCRSRPKDAFFPNVDGNGIFPNRTRPMESDPDVDVFYATFPGYEAFEIPVEDRKVEYNGIYSDILLKALGGGTPSIIRKVITSSVDKWGVFARELKVHLKEEVKRVSKDRNGQIQLADAEITSENPKYLAEFNDPNNPDEVLPETVPPVDNILLEDTTLIEDVIKADAEKIMKFDRKAKIGFYTGFIIHGDVKSVNVHDTNWYTMTRAGGNVLVSVFDEKALATFLLLFKDGTSTPLAVLKKFQGNILIRNSRVVNASYTPTKGNYLYEKVEENWKQLAERRTAAAAAAMYGKLSSGSDVDYLNSLAGYIRQAKAYDPTLGMYAAYAYAQAGAFDDVYDVYRYMAKEEEESNIPVLFDVSLLRTFYDFRSMGVAVAPHCPMLTQGWSYLSVKFDDDVARYPYFQRLTSLQKYLLPGLWTTFSPEGTKQFQENIYS